MIHLRLIVPAELTDEVYAHLVDARGVAHVAVVPTTSISPPGQLLLCDVAREAANDIIEWLQRRDVHHVGAITIEALEGVVSDAAERAVDEAPGHAADALIWEELEARARSDSALTASFLVFIGIASVIAGVGILLDAPILIVGAMVVGPEYGPLAALCIALVRGRTRPAMTAFRTLAFGLLVASAAALFATVAFRVANLAPDSYVLSDRELTAFISHPDGMAAVVAVLAGVVGMLSLTESRGGALIGVLVSVTTIPAAANLGVATAYGEWREVGGAALQLGINLAGLVLAGVATLAIQSRATTRR
ncbi:MAG TPA: DUF389 domain-containing protein [Acidimicrobiia bacterium]|nr:DUF389 domain-containing protein [Acidimicrobiia bacterium]